MIRRFRWTDRTRRLLWIALGAGGAVVLFHLVIMPIAVRHASDVAVPDLRGLTAAEATVLLQQAALAGGSVNEAVNETQAAGRIFRQSPLPGLRVRRGREVDFVVSAGPATQRVPKLTGDTLFHARFLLEREGIHTGRIRTVTHPNHPADQVLACSPPPGTPLGRRAVVDLLVSSGPPPTRYAMPDLRGLDAEAVKGMLEAAGLRVTRRARPTGGERRDEVVDQTPPPGHPIAAGGTVELTTSS